MSDDDEFDTNKKVRGWALTLHDYTEADYERWKTLPVTWMIYGREKCPTTGRPHLQGAVYCKNQIRLFPLIRLLGTPRVRARPWYAGDANGARGNAAYCSKDACDVVEYGVRPRQGRRVDIEEIKEVVHRTHSMRAVLDVATNLQQIQIAERHLKYMRPPRREGIEVYWYWGPTGTGKSHAAEVEAGEEAYFCCETSQYWEGYDGEKHVVIDDYRPGFSTFSWFLRLLDKYRLRVNCKYGSAPLCATKVWITSTKRPDEMWHGRTDEDVRQLCRRMTVVKYFGDFYVDPNSPVGLERQRVVDAVQKEPAWAAFASGVMED